MGFFSYAMNIKNDVFAVRELHIRSQYLPVCVELPVSIRAVAPLYGCSATQPIGCGAEGGVKFAV